MWALHRRTHKAPSSAGNFTTSFHVSKSRGRLISESSCICISRSAILQFECSHTSSPTINCYWLRYFVGLEMAKHIYRGSQNCSDGRTYCAVGRTHLVGLMYDARKLFSGCICLSQLCGSCNECCATSLERYYGEFREIQIWFALSTII